MQAHRRILQQSGLLAERRALQARAWMWSELQDRLVNDLEQTPAVRDRIASVEQQVAAGEIPATVCRRSIVTGLL